MNDTKRNHDELQTRREFFKKAARGVLPIIGAVTLTPLLTACPGGDDPTGCEGCEGTCSSSCSTTCKGTSSSGCTGCSAQCQSDCDTSCNTACTTTCTATCADDCSEGCKDNCSNTCSTTCEGTATGKMEISEADGKIDGYEYADLGLSVKWATYNLGAKAPEEYGTLYKGLYGSVGDRTTTFYTWSRNHNDSICGSEYDRATQNRGNKWRLPSYKELKELKNNCAVEVYTYKDIVGFKITSNLTNKSIFIPAADQVYYDYDTKKWSSIERGKYAGIWSGSLEWGNNSYGDLEWLGFGINSKGGADWGINQGDFEGYKLSIRPVSTGSGSSSGCNGNCTANCANNSSGSTGCSNNCKTECRYNCAGTCNDGCYGRCNNTCGGSCTYASRGSACSGCATTCYNRCYSACTRACSSNCESSCVHGSK